MFHDLSDVDPGRARQAKIMYRIFFKIKNGSSLKYQNEE
jgi:hypothetical protein